MIDIESYIHEKIYSAEREWYMNHPSRTRPKLIIYIDQEMKFDILSIRGRTSQAVVDFQDIYHRKNKHEMVGYPVYVVQGDHPPMEVYFEK